MILQAATANEAAATAFCDVLDSASNQCAPHQQGYAGLAVILGTAHVHCRAVYQHPGLSLVSCILSLPAACASL